MVFPAAVVDLKSGGRVGLPPFVLCVCVCLVGARDFAMWLLGLDPPSVVADADATLRIVVGGVAA